MKKLIIALLLLPLFSQAQVKTNVIIKIGSNYYINCTHLIRFGVQDVLNISYGVNRAILPTFDIYSEGGIKVASIAAGKLTTGDKNNYILTSNENEFTFSEKDTKRIICYIKKVKGKDNREELHVWADMFMPDGFLFQCTPETTNVPTLQYMTGSTFENAGTAIQLD